MGHYNETVTAVAKNRDSAQAKAIDESLYENGHRYSFRDCVSSKLLRKVPPKKLVEEPRGGFRYIVEKEVPDAPPGDWLEEWEFVLHFHA